eukprot:g4959.t1
MLRARTDLLTEHDLPKLITTVCNYFSLGQTELGRALWKIVMDRDLSKGLRILKIILWHGPPRHWLPSTSTPSSAHLAWFCLHCFMEDGILEVPKWLKQRMELDILIACALLDGAALQTGRKLTAEVANELRAYHAGLLDLGSRGGGRPGAGGASPQAQQITLPSLSVLPITPQLSSFASYLPAQTIEQKSFSRQNPRLSRQAPVLGHTLCDFLRIRALSDQMSIGLAADALLFENFDLACRHLRFLEPDPAGGVLPSATLYELFAFLLLNVVNTSPQTSANKVLRGLIASSATTGASSQGLPLHDWKKSAVRHLTEQFEQTSGAAGGDEKRGVLRPHRPDRKRFIYAALLSNKSNEGLKLFQLLEDEFLRLKTRTSTLPPAFDLLDGEHSEEYAGARGGGNQHDNHYPVGRGAAGAPLDNYGRAGATAGRAFGSTAAAYGASTAALRGTAAGPLRGGDANFNNQHFGGGGASRFSGAAATANHFGGAGTISSSGFGSRSGSGHPFQQLLRGGGANIMHGNTHSGGHHLSRPLAPRHEEQSWWDEYFEFTRVAQVHCLQYVVSTACRLVTVERKVELSALILEPFPQLKPLVILLTWYDLTLERRKEILDVLWQSYVRETRENVRKVGDLWIDFWVEVLDYSVRLSLWVANLMTPGDINEFYRVATDVLDRILNLRGRAGALSRQVGTAGVTEAGGRMTMDRFLNDDVDATATRANDSATPKVASSAASALAGGAPGAAASASSSSSVVCVSPSAAAPAAALLPRNAAMSCSFLFVMRTHLPNVDSDVMLRMLNEKLPTLRLRSAASQHSYDVDLTRCYYALRCVLTTVEALHNLGNSANAAQRAKTLIQDAIVELDRLVACIERTHLKMTVFVQICSLCFVRTSFLKNGGSKQMGKSGANTSSGSTSSASANAEGSIAGSSAGSGGCTGSTDAFLVPPPAVLSFLSLLRHHLARTEVPVEPASSSKRTNIFSPSKDARTGSTSRANGSHVPCPAASGNGNDHQRHQRMELHTMKKKLDEFTQEVLWRLFMTLKDYFLFARFRERMSLAADPKRWADAIGAVMVGREGFLPDHALNLDNPTFRQFTTPAETALSLQPDCFLPRMLSDPLVLLHRALRMNDYKLAEKILEYLSHHAKVAERVGNKKEFGSTAAIRSTVVVAKKFANFRRRMMRQKNLAEVEADVMRLCARYFVGEEALRAGFYILVDLAVSAAPHTGISTRLLKKALQILESLPSLGHLVAGGVFGDHQNRRSGGLKNWVARLNVLVEARTQYKTLANIILGIETLPSEPALLKSHLNRLHSQRHAIMSLVESVDLVKLGEEVLHSLSASNYNSKKCIVRRIVSKRPSRGAKQAQALSDTMGVDLVEVILNYAHATESAAVLDRTSAASATSAAGEQGDAIAGTTYVNSSPRASSGAAGAVVELGAPPATNGGDKADRAGVVGSSATGVVSNKVAGGAGSPTDPGASGTSGGGMAGSVAAGGQGAAATSKKTSATTGATPAAAGAAAPGATGVSSATGAASASSSSVSAGYAMSMDVIRVVESAAGPLLACLACLERRPTNWPSTAFLNYALDVCRDFPALRRWVAERTEVWDALFWACSGERMSFHEWGARTCKKGNISTSRAPGVTDFSSLVDENYHGGSGPALQSKHAGMRMSTIPLRKVHPKAGQDAKVPDLQELPSAKVFETPQKSASDAFPSEKNGSNISSVMKKVAAPKSSREEQTPGDKLSLDIFKAAENNAADVMAVAETSDTAASAAASATMSDSQDGAEDLLPSALAKLQVGGHARERPVRLEIFEPSAAAMAKAPASTGNTTRPRSVSLADNPKNAFLFYAESSAPGADSAEDEHQQHATASGATRTTSTAGRSDLLSIDGIIDGYTRHGLDSLPEEEKKALLAIGDDHEDLQRAAYSRLAWSLLEKKKYEEALEVCDQVDGVNHVAEEIFLEISQNLDSQEGDFLRHCRNAEHEYLYRLVDAELAASLVLRLYRSWDDTDVIIQAVTMCLRKLEASALFQGDDSVGDNSSGGSGGVDVGGQFATNPVQRGAASGNAQHAQMTAGSDDHAGARSSFSAEDTQRAKGLADELGLVLGNMTILKKVLECCGGKWHSWHEIDDLYSSSTNTTSAGEDVDEDTGGGVASTKKINYRHNFQNKSLEISSAALAADGVLDGDEEPVASSSEEEESYEEVSQQEQQQSPDSGPQDVSSVKMGTTSGAGEIPLTLAAFLRDPNAKLADTSPANRSRSYPTDQFSPELYNCRDEETDSALDSAASFERYLRQRHLEQSQDPVLSHLLSLNLHDLARQIQHMYRIPYPQVSQIELSRLEYLFTHADEKTEAVRRLLHFAPQQAVRFSFDLLDRFVLIAHRLLFCRMLLQHLRDWLSAPQIRHLEVLCASLELLNVVEQPQEEDPRARKMQPHYLRLLGSPVLLVESLLMNARADLLGPFLEDFPQYRVDALILRYVRKALSLGRYDASENEAAAVVDGAGGAGGRGPSTTTKAGAPAAARGARGASKLEWTARTGLGGPWCLSGNAQEDDALRRAHVYAAAPSISLAESLLDLLSDSWENARLCFNVCDVLSLRWQALLPRYRLITEHGGGNGRKSREVEGQNPPTGAEDDNASTCSARSASSNDVDSSSDASGAWEDLLDFSDEEGADAAKESPEDRNDAAADGAERTEEEGGDVEAGTPVDSCAAQPREEAPLTSVSIVSLLLRRLLVYLGRKFYRHTNFVLMVERSLRSLLPFMPTLWQTTGHKAGLKELCERPERLRDLLIRDDHLELAVELCERCSASTSGEAGGGSRDLQEQEHYRLYGTSEGNMLAGERGRAATRGSGGSLSTRTGYNLHGNSTLREDDDSWRWDASSTDGRETPASSSYRATDGSPVVVQRAPALDKHKDVPPKMLKSFSMSESSFGSRRSRVSFICSITGEMCLSADPVREAKVVALLQLYEFDRAQECLHELSAEKPPDSFLMAVEKAIRFPPLVHLAGLQQALSQFTTNHLHRKLYRSTSALAPFPLFLFPDQNRIAADSNLRKHRVAQLFGNYLPKNSFFARAGREYAGIAQSGGKLLSSFLACGGGPPDSRLRPSLMTGGMPLSAGSSSSSSALWRSRMADEANFYVTNLTQRLKSGSGFRFRTAHQNVVDETEDPRMFNAICCLYPAIHCSALTAWCSTGALLRSTLADEAARKQKRKELRNQRRHLRLLARLRAEAIRAEQLRRAGLTDHLQNIGTGVTVGVDMPEGGCESQQHTTSAVAGEEAEVPHMVALPHEAATSGALDVGSGTTTSWARSVGSQHSVANSSGGSQPASDGAQGQTRGGASAGTMPQTVALGNRSVESDAVVFGQVRDRSAESSTQSKSGTPNGRSFEQHIFPAPAMGVSALRPFDRQFPSDALAELHSRNVDGLLPGENEIRRHGALHHRGSGVGSSGTLIAMPSSLPPSMMPPQQQHRVETSAFGAAISSSKSRGPAAVPPRSSAESDGGSTDSSSDAYSDSEDEDQAGWYENSRDASAALRPGSQELRAGGGTTSGSLGQSFMRDPGESASSLGRAVVSGGALVRDAVRDALDQTADRLAAATDLFSAASAGAQRNNLPSVHPTSTKTTGVSTRKRTKKNKSKALEQNRSLVVSTFARVGMTMDASRVGIGCDLVGKSVLFSQSSLWPDKDFHHMRASPAGLPYSVPRIVRLPFLTMANRERPLSPRNFALVQRLYGRHQLSLLRLLVRENRLAETCYYVVQQRVSRPMFVEVVANHCLRTNQLADLLNFFMRSGEEVPTLFHLQEVAVGSDGGSSITKNDQHHDAAAVSGMAHPTSSSAAAATGSEDTNPIPVAPPTTSVITTVELNRAEVGLYLDDLKEFLREKRSLDLLYQYCVFTGDHVNAGLLSIHLFIISTTWDSRLGHLQDALSQLQQALEDLELEEHFVTQYQGAGGGQMSMVNASSGGTNSAGAVGRGAKAKLGVGKKSGAVMLASQPVVAMSAEQALLLSSSKHAPASGGNPVSDPGDVGSLAPTAGTSLSVGASRRGGGTATGNQLPDRAKLLPKGVLDPLLSVSNSSGNPESAGPQGINGVVSSGAAAAAARATAAPDVSAVNVATVPSSLAPLQQMASTSRIDLLTGKEVTPTEIRRYLQLVKFQTHVCEAMARDRAHLFDTTLWDTEATKFCHLSQMALLLLSNATVRRRCEVAEKLLTTAHFELAEKIMDFLDLPVVEICVRASNELATTEARKRKCAISPLMRFLHSAKKCFRAGMGEWDSLVSNMVNIWIHERKKFVDGGKDAMKLVSFMEDERCKLDALILIEEFSAAFHIAAKKLQSLEEVMYLKKQVQQAVATQEGQAAEGAQQGGGSSGSAGVVRGGFGAGAASSGRGSNSGGAGGAAATGSSLTGGGWRTNGDRFG